jgi:quercetin dioxygenase-like cupin family protein
VGVQLRRFEDLDWESGRPANVEPGTLGGTSGIDAGVVRRKWLAQDDLGLYAQYVQMPAGNVVRPHSHSRDELMMVVKGGCLFDETELGPGDSALISADTPYGFVVGDHGMEFLIVRTGAATLTRADESA